MDISSVKQENSKQADQHDYGAGLSITQTGLTGNSLYKNHKRVRADIQRDKKLAAEFRYGNANQQNK